MQATIEAVQMKLKEVGISAYLMADIGGRNGVGRNFLGIDHHEKVSRRAFFLIPADGEAELLVASVEPHILAGLPGKRRYYSSRAECDGVFDEWFARHKKVAMEYSSEGNIPSISLVDGGLVDWIRSKGVEIVSSDRVIQPFTTTLSEEQLTSHREAALVTREALDQCWELIGSGKPLYEKDFQELILDHFSQNGCVTEHLPIIAFGPNSGNPHYELDGRGSRLEPDQVVMIDLWCKKDRPDGVFADVTEMGYTGKRPPEKVQQAFDLVVKARDAGLRLLSEEREIRGEEVDRAVRDVIVKGGFGRAFCHRTGHHIFDTCHGRGTNFDSIESVDDRPINFPALYSIEPGIYLDSFGIRLECDVLVRGLGSVEVTTTLQNSLITPFS
ncbi:MAG: hypothetical protein S4CHLAM102_01940 [Chlamydiia bacterium]|nr:hypothetical protein [Chlamydiia bacterium]